MFFLELLILGLLCQQKIAQLQSSIGGAHCPHCECRDNGRVGLHPGQGRGHRPLQRGRRVTSLPGSRHCHPVTRTQSQSTLICLYSGFVIFFFLITVNCTSRDEIICKLGNALHTVPDIQNHTSFYSSGRSQLQDVKD